MEASLEEGVEKCRWKEEAKITIRMSENAIRNQGINYLKKFYNTYISVCMYVCMYACMYVYMSCINNIS